jgi:hypothetical protein
LIRFLPGRPSRHSLMRNARAAFPIAPRATAGFIATRPPPARLFSGWPALPSRPAFSCDADRTQTPERADCVRTRPCARSMHSLSSGRDRATPYSARARSDFRVMGRAPFICSSRSPAPWRSPLHGMIDIAREFAVVAFSVHVLVYMGLWAVGDPPGVRGRPPGRCDWGPR